MSGKKVFNFISIVGWLYENAFIFSSESMFECWIYYEDMIASTLHVPSERNDEIKSTLKIICLKLNLKFLFFFFSLLLADGGSQFVPRKAIPKTMEEPKRKCNENKNNRKKSRGKQLLVVFLFSFSRLSQAWIWIFVEWCSFFATLFWVRL